MQQLLPHGRQCCENMAGFSFHIESWRGHNLPQKGKSVNSLRQVSVAQELPSLQASWITISVHILYLKRKTWTLKTCQKDFTYLFLLYDLAVSDDAILHGFGAGTGNHTAPVTGLATSSSCSSQDTFYIVKAQSRWYNHRIHFRSCWTFRCVNLSASSPSILTLSV